MVAPWLKRSEPPAVNCQVFVRQPRQGLAFRFHKMEIKNLLIYHWNSTNMENSMENSSSNHSKRKRPNLSVLGLRRRSSSSNPPLLDLQDGGQRSGRSESFQPSQQPPIPASPPHLEVSKIISQNPTKTPEENNNGNNNGNDLFYHTRKKRKIVYTKERRRRRSAKSLPQPSAPNEIDIDEETDDEKDPPLLDLQDGGRRSGRSESFQPSQQPPIPASYMTMEGRIDKRGGRNACRGLMPSVYKEGGRRGRSASKSLPQPSDIDEETDDEKELSDRTKRPQNGYFMYMNANRARIKEENEGCSFGDIGKIASKEYKELAADELAVWTDKVAKDKVRYEKELAKYVVPAEFA